MLRLVPPAKRAHNYLKHVLTGKILLVYPGETVQLPFGEDSDWASERAIPGRTFRLIGETPSQYCVRTGVARERVSEPPAIKSPASRPRRPVEFF